MLNNTIEASLKVDLNHSHENNSKITTRGEFEHYLWC